MHSLVEIIERKLLEGLVNVKFSFQYYSDYDNYVYPVIQTPGKSLSANLTKLFSNI